MQAILPLENISCAAPASQNEAGPAPQLQWLKIADLVVDPSYQRPVGANGRRNIRTIAEGFRWAAFSPVVVSPVAGGLYAIVDGQHRTTAAALCGFEAVPCQIILATQDGQAKAFSAINGVTTRVHPMHLHKAAVAAGDADANAIERAAKAANVTVLPYPKQILQQQPGETMAFGTIGKVIKDHGHDVAVAALKIIRSPANDGRGVLLGVIIRSVADAVAALQAVRTQEQIAAAFAQVKLVREFDHALAEARAKGGGTHAAALTRRLLNKLHAILSRAA